MRSIEFPDRVLLRDIGQIEEENAIKAFRRANSGGSLPMSLLVAITNTSVSWSLSQVNNAPKSRLATPESPVEPTPLRPLSISSTKATQGLIASMMPRAWRTFLSVSPTTPPYKLPKSRIKRGPAGFHAQRFCELALPTSRRTNEEGAARFDTVLGICSALAQKSLRLCKPPS